MALLSTKDEQELQDAFIAAKPRLTTKNAKQFGRIFACMHFIGINITDDFTKTQFNDAKKELDDVWEDLNSVDYV